MSSRVALAPDSAARSAADRADVSLLARTKPVSGIDVTSAAVVVHAPPPRPVVPTGPDEPGTPASGRNDPATTLPVAPLRRPSASSDGRRPEAARSRDARAPSTRAAAPATAG